MVLVDINEQERFDLLTHLKAYYGLHSGDLSDSEQERLVNLINKIEAIKI
jgi:hypothetical protein